MKIIKITIIYTISFISFILSYIIPKKKKLYIFWWWGWNNFSWNTKAMFLYFLKKNNTKQIFYLTRNKKLFKSNIPNLVKINSIKWYWLFIRAEIIFINNWTWDVSNSSQQLWKFKIINLWHWDPIKQIWINSNLKLQNNFLFRLSFKLFNNKNIKFITTSSKISANNLKNAFITNNIKVTWLARNDIFFKWNEYLEFYDIKKILNIYNYNKIIIYTPTFRDNKKNISPFSNSFLSQLNKYLKINNYIFLIKWHPNTNIILSKKHSNIKDISKIEFDIQELLKYTDLMITDYSSIYIDFLLTYKPIIFYAYDLEKYLKKNRDMYFNYKDVIIKNNLIKKEYLLLEKIKKSINIKPNKEYIKLLNLFHKYKNWWYIRNIINEINNIEKKNI